MKQNFTNKNFLIVSTAVRVLFWHNKPMPPPEFDEDGYPVMAGSDKFYLLATNAGRDHLLLMTFEPADYDAMENWTLHVVKKKVFKPGEKLVLRCFGDEREKFLICSSFERHKYPQAEVFGVINERAEAGQFAAELAELQQQNNRDFEDGGSRYDYGTDFGA